MAEPDSFVGLLALDLSVHLLNSDYNLDIDRMFKELIADQTYSKIAYNYPGEISGLITLTNANFEYLPRGPSRECKFGYNHLHMKNNICYFTWQSAWA